MDQLEIEEMRSFLLPYMPEVARGKCVATATCMYTMTPDSHFLIDYLPNNPFKNVIIASPCSGHGFKFCSVIGESLADLVMND